MALEILKDRKIIGRIEKERELSPLRPFITMLMERFKDYHALELGGTVRDVIISEWYGKPFTLRDWDLIIDDSEKQVDLFALCEGLPGNVGKNFFGNVKWKVDGYEFDITKCSSEKSADGVISLENFLSGSDFNVGTIAYCQEHGEILSLNALEGIRQRKLSLMNPDPRRPQAALVRMINFEKRLGFSLDKKCVDYIRQNYLPGMDQKIMEYVAYKEMPERTYHHVIERLNQIVTALK